MAKQKLTLKQQRFAEIFDGNGTQAARDAGYNGSSSALGKIAYDLLRLPHIEEAIKNRQPKSIGKKIAVRVERQAWWSELMLDEQKEMNVRLKASELLGKSEGDFLQKIEHSGTLTLEELVAGSNEPDKV